MLDSRETRALELSSAFYGVSTFELMRNAGRGVAEFCFSLKPKKVLVVCGLGNNGGDGLVAARVLAEKVPTSIVLLGRREAIRHPEARAAFMGLSGVCLYEVSSKKALRSIVEFTEADVLVDAVLGTGVKGKLREPVRTAVDLINKSKAKVVSVDVPSGVDPDTGEFSEKVDADFVLCMHDVKPFVSRMKKRVSCAVVDIGLAERAVSDCGPGDVFLARKPRVSDSHKGFYGRVLVLGGSRDLVGAPALAALAALRSGVDISAVASVEDVAETINCFSPDIITYKLSDSDFLGENDVEKAVSLAKKSDVVLLGPGMGLGSRGFVEGFCKKVEKPLVLDADALKLLASKKSLLKNKTVLVTPHAREFEAFFGEKLPKNFPERQKRVSMLAKKSGVTVLLKGACDVVSDGESSKICRLGNPRMAVGGTGDVLAGLAAGFLAQCGNAFRAACAASFLNKHCGDRLFSEKNTSFVASELLDEVPRVFSEFFGKKAPG